MVLPAVVRRYRNVPRLSFFHVIDFDENLSRPTARFFMAPATAYQLVDSRPDSDSLQ
jgi:hypothetical protein